MRKLSRKTWLMLAALLGGLILAGSLILPVMAADGNKLVTFGNYLEMKRQQAARLLNRKGFMSVEEVEAILGPPDSIEKWRGEAILEPSDTIEKGDPLPVPDIEARLYRGQRCDGCMRPHITVRVFNGRALYAEYKDEHEEPTLVTRITDYLRSWLRRKTP
jgi:hypothetical protein